MLWDVAHRSRVSVFLYRSCMQKEIVCAEDGRGARPRRGAGRKGGGQRISTSTGRRTRSGNFQIRRFGRARRQSRYVTHTCVATPACPTISKVSFHGALQVVPPKSNGCSSYSDTSVWCDSSSKGCISYTRAPQVVVVQSTLLRTSPCPDVCSYRLGCAPFFTSSATTR